MEGTIVEQTETGTTCLYCHTAVFNWEVIPDDGETTLSASGCALVACPGCPWPDIADPPSIC